MPDINKFTQLAKQKGYSDADIQSYLAQKGVSAPKQSTAGGIGNFLYGLIKPTTDYLGEAGYQGARFVGDTAFRKSVMGGKLTAEEAKRLSEEPATRFLKEEDVASPLAIAKTGTKAAANAASFAVPGGGGTLAKILGRGALAGGLSGYGQSQNGQELPDILGGAALGAGGNALLSKVIPGLFKGAGKVGGAMRQGVVNPKVSASPYAVKEQQAIVKGLQEMGLTGSAQAQMNKMPKVMDDLTTKISGILGKSKKSVTTANVVKDIGNALDESMGFVPGDTAYETAKNRFISKLVSKANQGENGLSLTAKQLFEYKQQLNKDLSRAFTKIARGTPLTPAEEVGMAIWGKIDEIVTQVEPAVKDLTLKQSTLYKASSGLMKSAEKTAGIPVPLAGKINIPGLNRLVQGTQDLAGRGLQGAGNLNVQSLSKIPPAAANVVSQIGGQNEQAQTAPTAPVQPQQSFSPVPQVDPTVQTGGNQGEIQQALIALMLADPKNASAYKSIMEMMGGGGVKVNSTEKVKIDLANSGLRGLDSAEQLLANDPGIVNKQLVPGKFFTREYQSAITRAVEGLLRARSGAAVPESEVKRYINEFTPVFGDSPEIAQTKLQQLRQDLQAVAKPSGAGMDTNSLISALAGM